MAVPQPVLLGDQHGQHLAPAGRQRVEDLGIRVPEGAHRGTDSVGEVSQHRRIERIGLGQRPGGPGESRTWRGLTTTTGSAAAASAATSGNSKPPVASSSTRAGPRPTIWETNSLIPVSS